MVVLDEMFLDSINKGQPGILADRRSESFRIFSEMELPHGKEENWKYTDTGKIDLKEIENGKEEIIFRQHQKIDNVIFCDIQAAIKDHYDILSKHLPMSLLDMKEDKFAAMHASFWKSGVFVYVPKNTEVSLHNIFSLSGFIASHSIIIVSENSTLDYFEEHKSLGNAASFRSSGMEIFMKPNSRLRFHDFQDWSNKTINIANWKADLGKDSKIDWIFGQFGGKLSRIKIDTMFNGQGSESKTYGVFYGKDGQHFDITTDAYHKTTDTSCDILVKGVLDDASSVYRGKIKIDKDAQRTNSFLADHSLLFGEDSISNSIPSLEIDANDVKASHGATLGKPNEEEIFYIMARGLPKEEAERLIIQGYFSQIIEKISDPDLKERFNDAVMHKISER